MVFYGGQWFIFFSQKVENKIFYFLFSLHMVINATENLVTNFPNPNTPNTKVNKNFHRPISNITMMSTEMMMIYVGG